MQTRDRERCLGECVGDGPFEVAIREGLDVPTREGTTELVGIVNAIPRFPRFTGTGQDGRMSRFNASGEFVFRGGISPNGGTDDAVYVVSVEEPPAPCDVTVRQRGGTIVATSDGGASAVQLPSCRLSSTVPSALVSRIPVSSSSGTSTDWER